MRRDETPGSLDGIIQNAADSAIASNRWKERGVAPLGYTKGMALVFARTLCKLKAEDPFALEMAKADAGNDDRDALAHCRSICGRRYGQLSFGPDTLRHLFTLLMELGMRESSGRYCEGRDRSTSNTDAESAEAGLFQTSFSARSSSALLPRLFEQASANRAGFLDIFKEEVRCRASDLENFGEGLGRDFQQLSKSPAFATEFAAITLRNDRQHYGPINKRKLRCFMACGDVQAGPDREPRTSARFFPQPLAAGRQERGTGARPLLVAPDVPAWLARVRMISAVDTKAACCMWPG
jgi:hypothetical protein